MTIDVTELLTDPDFVTSNLVAISRAQSVNDAGRAENTEVRTTFSGVVFPGTGNMMLRTPDGERVTGDISIVTRHYLTDGIGQGRTADVVFSAAYSAVHPAAAGFTRSRSFSAAYSAVHLS